jgi:hypothetical protein
MHKESMMYVTVSFHVNVFTVADIIPDKTATFLDLLHVVKSVIKTVWLKWFLLMRYVIVTNSLYFNISYNRFTKIIVN